MRPLKNKDYYLAQEVVDKFGISKKTLFDWEKQGIIPKIPKDWRGWRMYSERHLEQIAKVIEQKKKMVR
jgi:adenine-specific DNA-methyltransferase